MANELRFIDSDLLFDDGDLAMSADCCCEQSPPDCDGLPGHWLVAISDLPDINNGGTHGSAGSDGVHMCDPADSHDPYVFCTATAGPTAGQDAVMKQRAYCLLMVGDWELPYVSTGSGSPAPVGDPYWHYSSETTSVPNVSTGGCVPDVNSRNMTTVLDVWPCVDGTQVSDVTVNFVATSSDGRWTGTATLHPGETYLDLPATTLTWNPSSSLNVCAHYPYSATTCARSSDIAIDAPTCVITPNG